MSILLAEGDLGVNKIDLKHRFMQATGVVAEALQNSSLPPSKTTPRDFFKPATRGGGRELPRKS